MSTSSVRLALQGAVQSDYRTAWVRVFGGKHDEVATANTWLPSIDALPDTRSDRRILTLMKGWTGSTRPLTSSDGGRTCRFPGGMRKGDGTGGRVGEEDQWLK